MSYQSQCSLLANQCSTRFFSLLAQQRNGQVLAISGRNGTVLVRSSTQIHMAKERFTVLHSSNDNIDPQRIEATTLLVKHSGQPVVQRLGLHLDAIVVVVIVHHFLVDVFLDELEVGIVSADSDNRIFIDFEYSVDVAETSKRSVRHKGIGGDYNASVELDADHRASSRDWLPGGRATKRFEVRIYYTQVFVYFFFEYYYIHL